MSRQWIVALGLMVASAVSPATAQATTIFMSGEFGIEYRGSGNPPEHDPPLEGLLRFDVRSPPYNPNDSGPDFYWPTRDFEFIFLGRMWDESDVLYCACDYYDEQLRGMAFEFDDGNNYWLLSFNYDDGNFGVVFDIDDIGGAGTSEDGEAGASGDITALHIPEPGTFALLGLGLAGLGFSRRRIAA
jgi:hypothetical protein